MSQIAEEANEVKSRFLVNMSYNIRIPLNNVLGFSQLMTTDPESMDADQWKEYSEIIQTNSAELRARPLQTGGRQNEMADTGARNHLLMLGRSRYGTHEMRR